MARFPRLLLSNIPHHITQRGNRRQQTFYGDDDYIFYLRIFNEVCETFDVGINAYCLMPNHVHLILTPTIGERIRDVIVETHSAYTRRLNCKMGWKGYLWQGRFFSSPMDSQHFQAAIPYVEFNPVRAGLCINPEDYRWSSAKSNRSGQKDPFVNLQSNFSSTESLIDDGMIKSIRKLTRSGRPMGSEDFIKRFEKETGRVLLPQKPGPKPSNSGPVV